MALNGIGGNGAGSALDRFQALRDAAKQKIEGADNRTRLAEMLKQKQSELGVGKGLAAKPQTERIPSAASAAVFSAPQAINGSSSYGRAGAMEKPDPQPKLGRYIDFRA